MFDILPANPVYRGKILSDRRKNFFNAVDRVDKERGRFYTFQRGCKMKTISYILGIVFTISLIIVILISSIEFLLYGVPGYFESEYEKNQVLEDVGMEMDDLLDVTDQMMDYLRGDREELQVITEIDGETRGFFNEREIAHMEDVKSLFLGGLSLRRICLLICAAALILLYKLKRLKVLPASILMGTGIFFAAVCLLSLIVASDFQRSFTIFHQIFFDNDLWILNPNTDLLVNIVPEQFFMDTALYIVLIFGAAILVLFLIGLYFFFRIRRAGSSRKPRP